MSGERRWIYVAVAIIVVGAAIGMLHRFDLVPLWVSTAGTVLMAVGAIWAAIAAARAYQSENQSNG